MVAAQPAQQILNKKDIAQVKEFLRYFLLHTEPKLPNREKYRGLFLVPKPAKSYMAGRGSK